MREFATVPMTARMLLLIFVVMSGRASKASGDPFGGDDPGFRPIDAPKGPISTCERRVAKAVSQLAARVLRCHRARASGRFKSVVREDACERTAMTKFTSSTPTVGCGSCTNLARLANELHATLSSENAQIYCSTAGTPFGGDDAGTIPRDAPRGPLTKCTSVVAKALGKLVVRLLRCQSQQATGSLTDDLVENACETAARAKFATTQTKTCDSCVQLALLGDGIEASIDQDNGQIYCARPPLPCGTFLITWGGPGTGIGQFSNPIGVAVDGQGNVVVADTGNDRIEQFDSDGTFLRAWGSTGTGNGEFLGPTDVTVDGNGNVFVVDEANNRIEEFNSDGMFLILWGHVGGLSGAFGFPAAAAVDPSGNIFVADTANHRVQKFTPDGTFLTAWGSPGGGNGQFRFPSAVAVDQAGNVFVADTGNDRIEKFDEGGGFIATWGGTGSEAGQFMSPSGVAVDGNGHVFVADTGNDRLEEFDNGGTFLTAWGSPGSQQGQFDRPHGIAVDSVGDVFVADTGNARIEEFACTSSQ